MEQVFEMASMSKQKTRQPFSLWIDSEGKTRNPGHNGLRVKAVNNGVEVDVGFLNHSFTTYNTSPEDIKKFGHIRELKGYLEDIKPLLELHWDKEIEDGDFIAIATIYSKYKGNLTLLDSVEKAVDIIGDEDDVEKIQSLLEDYIINIRY